MIQHIDCLTKGELCSDFLCRPEMDCTIDMHINILNDSNILQYQAEHSFLLFDYCMTSQNLNTKRN